MDNSGKIFTLYKPLRNKVKALEMIDSMEFIWLLTNHLQFDKKLPTKVQLPSDYPYKGDVNHRRIKGITEWHLEFLLMELLMHSQTKIFTGKSLFNFRYLKNVANGIRTLENDIDKLFMYKGTAFRALFRLAHQQFPWQDNHLLSDLYRYYRIYNSKELQPLFFSTFNLLPKDFYLSALATISSFMNHFVLKDSARSSIPTISSESLQQFLAHYQITYEDIKQDLIDAQEMNSKLFFSYNPLRAKPIITINHNLYCPQLPLLISQITSGVFYSMHDKSGYDNAIGLVFEKYVGYIIELANFNYSLEIYPEIKYSSGKASADWIIKDENSVLFIECKTKRVTLASRNELEMVDEVKNDLKIFGDAVVQAYKTISDYKINQYPNFDYEEEKKHFIHILTLEENFLSLLEGESKEFLLNHIKEELNKNEIDIAIIEEIPYSFESIRHFEKHIQLICKIGIGEYFDKFHTNELYDLTSRFEYKVLNKEDFLNELYYPALNK